MKPSKTLERKIQTMILVPLSILAAPFIFLSSKFKSRTQGSSPRVLVIPQLTRIGDVVCSTPVFYSLKKDRPDSYLAVLVSAMTSPLLENNPRIDEIIILEDYSLFGLIKKIRDGNYDWSFSLSGTSLSSALALLGGVAHRAKITRVGRPWSELLTDWTATERIFYKSHRYLPQVYLSFLTLLGINPTEEKKEVFADPDSEKMVEDFLRSHNVQPDNVLVGISVAAGNPIKEWGDEKFLELAQRIKKLVAAKIIFIGTPWDEKRISALADTDPDFLKATTFDLKSLPALLKKLSFFISGDTGPMHIANALGIPLVDIIGPVHPGELAPTDPKSKIVLPEPYVAPTIFAFGKAGPAALTRLALENTSVERVFNTLTELQKNIR